MVSSSCEAFQTHYHHAFDIFETMGKKSNSGPLCYGVRDVNKEEPNLSPCFFCSTSSPTSRCEILFFNWFSREWTYTR